jgi:hypothetical protein
MPSGDLPKPARRVRLEISVSDDIIAAIDDYRFATRKPNRAEAVRQLLEIGRASHLPSDD